MPSTAFVHRTATVAFQLPSTRLAHRWTPRKLLFIGTIVQGVGLLALAGAGTGYFLLIGAVLLMALGQMLYAPSVSTFTSRLAAPGHTATYQAALSTTEAIGTVTGPTTGLALGGLGGSRLIWLLACPLCLSAALGSARASRTKLGGSRSTWQTISAGVLLDSPLVDSEGCGNFGEGMPSAKPATSWLI